MRFVASLRLHVFAALAIFAFTPVHAQEEAKPQAAETPDPAKKLENTLYLDLSTGGRVTIQLLPQLAPNHVERIKTLTRRGFYNGLTFHRVIEGFMAQTGDPLGTGAGNSDLPDLKAEFSKFPHMRGTVSAARLGNDADTANSQFFITFMPRFDLDNKYTVFGRVIKGMQFVQPIKRGEPPVNPDRILQASIAADNKPEPNYNAANAPRPGIAPGDTVISVK